MTSVTNPSVEDGDCRYLSKEILAEDFEYLPKADIFSLGLTVFELVSLFILIVLSTCMFLFIQGNKFMYCIIKTGY